MKPYIKQILRAVLYLFLHLWVVGTILSIGLALYTKDWSMNTADSDSLGSYLLHIRGRFFRFRTVFGAIMPYGEFEMKLAKLIWYTIFIPVFFYLSPFIKSWSSGSFKDASDYGSHGSARWAKPKEIFRKGEITGSPVNERNGSGVILGNEKKTFGVGEYITLPPDSELNRNVLVYGNSGIGKGQTMIIPQIFHAMDPFQPNSAKRLKNIEERNLPIDRSLVIFDPKGEHYKYTAQSLREADFEVYVLNLIKMSASHRWNAMDYVEEDLDAEKLANLIVPNSDSHGDPFWPNAERALMSAVILFVKYELPPLQNNLANVIHIGLTYGREEDTLNLLFDSLPYNHPAVARFKIFRVAPPETRAGILIGFGTQLSLFGYKEIQKLTSQSDFRLDEIGMKKTALFLIIPDSDDTYKPITTLFMDQMFQQLWKVADENGETLPVGVDILGDEFVNVGKIPKLAERTSVMRGKGVALQIYVQAKSQLVNLYKDEAESIIQNFDTVVFLGTNDKKTAEEFSTDIGDGTIKITSTSQQQNGVFSPSNPNVSEQHQGRRLITPDELRRKSRKQNIVLQNGGYPFMTIKTRFVEHPNAKGYQKLNPKELIPPKHKGFELFSDDDYNLICGLNLTTSTVDPEEASSNFKGAVSVTDALQELDGILRKDVAAMEIEEELIQAGPISMEPVEAIFETAAANDDADLPVEAFHMVVEEFIPENINSSQKYNYPDFQDPEFLKKYPVFQTEPYTGTIPDEFIHEVDPQEDETDSAAKSKVKNALDLI